MSWNEAIGGYFELELNNFGSIYHDNLIALNSGRNALEYILIQKGYKKIYVPYYTCDVTLQPLKRQNVNYEFYLLDKGFYPKKVVLKDKEALLYVNYYGIMNKQVAKLSVNYGNLIIDNSQAFYQRPIPNIDTFYSPRKFFGLPDGGLASCNGNKEIQLQRDYSLNRMSHLLKRIDLGAEKGYEEFKMNDHKMDNLPLKKMSRLTEKLMYNIQFNQAKSIRVTNFNKMHESLRKNNELTPLIENSSFAAPMIYPFLNKGNNILRSQLLLEKVFIARYWPNVKEWLGNKSCFESYLQESLIPLPVDQRYDKESIDYILQIVK